MTLQSELCTATNKCFNYQRTDHYVENCPIRIHSDLKLHHRSQITKSKISIRDKNHIAISTPSTLNKISKHTVSLANKCHRCDRLGHWANNCYAKTDVDGYYIDDSDNSYEDSDNSYGDS